MVVSSFVCPVLLVWLVSSFLPSASASSEMDRAGRPFRSQPDGPTSDTPSRRGGTTHTHTRGVVGGARVPGVRSVSTGWPPSRGRARGRSACSRPRPRVWLSKWGSPLTLRGGIALDRHWSRVLVLADLHRRRWRQHHHQPDSPLPEPTNSLHLIRSSPSPRPDSWRIEWPASRASR